MSGYLLKKRSFAILYDLNHLKLEGGHHLNFMNLGIIGLILSQFENRVPLKLVLEGAGSVAPWGLGSRCFEVWLECVVRRTALEVTF